MIELHPSGAETASGVGTPIDLGPTDRLLRITLTVNSLVGTLAIVVESSASSSGPWRQCGDATSDTISATVAYDRWVRLRWTGTAQTSPSAAFESTFAVTADVDRCYANFDDLYLHGRPEKALSDVSTTERAIALATASTKADGKLGLRYDLPLTAWGSDLREVVAKIAGYDLLSFQGFNPDGQDANIRTRHNDATSWLREVADSMIEPLGIVDSTPEVEDDGIAVVSYPSRGWR